MTHAFSVVDFFHEKTGAVTRLMKTIILYSFICQIEDGISLSRNQAANFEWVILEETNLITFIKWIGEKEKIIK